VNPLKIYCCHFVTLLAIAKFLVFVNSGTAAAAAAQSSYDLLDIAVATRMRTYAASRGSSTQNDVESSLLLDGCLGLFHVVCSRPSLCQSISSYVFLVFLSHAHIRGVPVSDIWYHPFCAHDQNTVFTAAVYSCIHMRFATSRSRPTLSVTRLFIPDPVSASYSCNSQ